MATMTMMGRAYVGGGGGGKDERVKKKASLRESKLGGASAGIYREMAIGICILSYR